MIGEGPVNLQPRLPTASFAYNILSTASFAYIHERLLTSDYCAHLKIKI